MALVDRVSPLTPARLWSELDPDTRTLAARALYRDWEDAGRHRAEADRAIAGALRFRPQAVAKLPVDKRVDYLSRAVRPDDSLATSLLMALHLTHRKDLLGEFLDRLGVPHDGGVIDPECEPRIEDSPRIREALTAVRERFPPEQVDLYLASLIAIDPQVWGPVSQVLEAERG